MSRAGLFVWPAATAILAAALLIVAAGRGETRDTITALLSTGQTVLSQPITYPTQGPARIVSAIVTMLPGEETGWHQHDVPMYGYILEGEVTVDYGEKGMRVYRRGEAVIEAVDWPHNGRNTGKVPARVLAVFIGADGVPDTVMLPGHEPQ